MGIRYILPRRLGVQQDGGQWGVMLAYVWAEVRRANERQHAEWSRHILMGRWRQLTGQFQVRQEMWVWSAQNSRWVRVVWWLGRGLETWVRDLQTRPKGHQKCMVLV